MKRHVIATILALILNTLAGVAASHPGAGALNLTFNTSARFEALGSAGVAVPWGGDTNHWANPALLAHRQGAHYHSFESQLARGLADDIVLTNEEFTLGAYGVTVLWARHPFTGNRLSMGLQRAYDSGGNLLGEYESYMKGPAWGVGVDLVRVYDLVRGRGEDGWSRRFSLSVGATWSEYEARLRGSMIIDPALEPEFEPVTSSSRGVAARATVLDGTAGRGNLADRMLGLRVEVAGGFSLLNDTDDFIDYHDSDQSDPMPRLYLKGWSARIALPFHEEFRGGVRGSLARLAVDAIDPLLSVTHTRQLQQPGLAWDTGTRTYNYVHDTSGVLDERGWGWEVGLANVFFWRTGNFTVEYGDMDGPTSGWGVNLALGELAGWRYDEATVPQAKGLPTVERRSWSVWVDPLAVVAHLRGE